MSARGLKGTTTWLLGFLTLLAILNTLNAMIQLNAGTSVTYFRILGADLGSLNVDTYFWLSFIATFICFSATVASVYRGIPADPRILQRLAKVEENLATASNMLENTQIGFFKRLDESEKANEEIFRKASLGLEDMKKETSENIIQQKKTLESIEEETRKNAETVKKQAGELNDVKKKIDQIGKEIAVAEQKARLSSRSDLKKFKSIDPRLATKLSEMNITTVSDLLTADPVRVAERASELVENVANRQAEAQLLMIPGIDEEHARLLVKVGITSRKELANQDPVQLYRSMVGIAKTAVDKGEMPASKIPTIEDISQWTRQAKL